MARCPVHPQAWKSGREQGHHPRKKRSYGETFEKQWINSWLWIQIQSLSFVLDWNWRQHTGNPAAKGTCSFRLGSQWLPDVSHVILPVFSPLEKAARPNHATPLCPRLHLQLRKGMNSTTEKNIGKTAGLGPFLPELAYGPVTIGLVKGQKNPKGDKKTGTHLLHSLKGLRQCTEKKNMP